MTKVVLWGPTVLVVAWFTSVAAEHSPLRDLGPTSHALFSWALTFFNASLTIATGGVFLVASVAVTVSRAPQVFKRFYLTGALVQALGFALLFVTFMDGNVITAYGGLACTVIGQGTCLVAACTCREPLHLESDRFAIS